jgi:alpha-L-fucosidase
MGSQTPAQSHELYQLVHRLQPECMVSSRLGNDQGDFTVLGDNTYPDYSIGVPWQSPASFFDETWGYRSWQVRGSEDEKYKEKLESLIGVVSGGGNYLLNIGPKGDGSVVPFEKDVLLKIGNWLAKNGEAVYGATADPFTTAFKWGNVSCKPDKLYLFITTPPTDDLITLPGLKGKIESIKVLGENTQISFKQTADNNTIITLPKDFDSAGVIKVIQIDLPVGYHVLPSHIITSSPKNIVLNDANAYNYYSSSGIDYGTYFQSTVKQSWTIETDHKGQYQPVLNYSDEEKGREIDLTIGNKTVTVKLDSGAVLNLKNDISGLKWGPVYISDKYSSGFGGLNGNAMDIDVTKPWTSDTSKHWHLAGNLGDGKQIELPGGMYTAYYVVQNVTSPGKAAYVQLKIVSGDGVMVYLNGKRRFIHNNPDKLPSMTDVIGLDLQAGNNQLLIQVFNNFKKTVPFTMDHNIPQKIYQKTLEPITLNANQLYPVSWKLHNPPTPHQTMNVPNLELMFVKK